VLPLSRHVRAPWPRLRKLVAHDSPRLLRCMHGHSDSRICYIHLLSFEELSEASSPTVCAPPSGRVRESRLTHLDRMVIRIMIMVPIYAIASFISIFSLNAAFAIDAVRDVYEVRSRPLIARLASWILTNPNRHSSSTVSSSFFWAISEVNGRSSSWFTVGRRRTPCSPSPSSGARLTSATHIPFFS
jgi:hypothetical protein